MAALFPKIYDTIEQNPHKFATLRWREPISTEGSSELWDMFQMTPLDPPGALSFLLMRLDPMYGLGSQPLRKQILKEHLLQLHERVEKELVGRRFPRKKIQDLLANQISAQSPTSSVLLEEVLCELHQRQKILIDRRNKSISFCPSDPRLWTTDKPVDIGELDNAWVFTPNQSFFLRSWLQNKEEEGWKITWPTADAKFEDLKSILLQRGSLPSGKVKKEDLALLLGKLQAIQTLGEIEVKSN
jgi:hypothetical protein